MHCEQPHPVFSFSVYRLGQSLKRSVSVSVLEGLCFHVLGEVLLTPGVRGM